MAFSVVLLHSHPFINNNVKKRTKEQIQFICVRDRKLIGNLKESFVRAGNHSCQKAQGAYNKNRHEHHLCWLMKIYMPKNGKYERKDAESWFMLDYCKRSR